MGMKFNKKKTTSLRKTRLAHYNAKGVKLTKLISAGLTKELKAQYENKIKRFPVRKGDTVAIFTGDFKNREGVVTKVCRHIKKINVEGCDKNEGEKTVSVNIDPSNVRISKFGTEGDRMKLVERKIQRVDAVLEANTLTE